MRKFYVTMGQNHVHRFENIIIDKDIVVEIEVEDENMARQKAFSLFGLKWSMIYNAENFGDSIKFFPRGIVNIKDL